MSLSEDRHDTHQGKDSAAVCGGGYESQRQQVTVLLSQAWALS